MYLPLDTFTRFLFSDGVMNDQGRNTQRVTLFQSDRLEALTFISARWFIAIWGLVLPLIAYVGWGSVSAPLGVGLWLIGGLIWTLFEYVAHRYLFHWDARWTPGKWLVFLIHGNHHVTPNDPLRNMMPPIVSVPVGGLIWAALVAVFGPSATWLFLGFMCGYVAYDFTHYACHQYPMRGALGQMLKRHHMRHHHIAEHGNYAITAIFWDRVFGSGIPSVAAGAVGVGKVRSD